MLIDAEVFKGLSLSNDLRQIAPKPYYEYWVSLLPQTSLNVRVHNLFGEKKVTDLSAPTVTKTYPRQQQSYETKDPVDLSSFGETVRAPLGYIVMVRYSSHSAAAECLSEMYSKIARPLFGMWNETDVPQGRSGDKASDCNVGFFMRNDDEWDWLRSFMTIERVKQLLGPEEYKGKPIDRFEVPHLRAVHFLLHDHLEYVNPSASQLESPR